MGPRTCSIEAEDLVAQIGGGELPRRGDVVGPLVVSGTGDLEQNTRHGDVAVLFSPLPSMNGYTFIGTSPWQETVAPFKMSRARATPGYPFSVGPAQSAPRWSIRATDRHQPWPRSGALR